MKNYSFIQAKAAPSSVWSGEWAGSKEKGLGPAGSVAMSAYSVAGEST